MKYPAIIIASAAALLAVSCTQKTDDRPVQVDANGIPLEVASLILGDSVKIDTLYHSDRNTVRYIDNNLYFQKIIFDNNGLVAYNPFIEIESTGVARYNFKDLIRSIDIDFSDPEGLKNLKEAFPVYEDFMPQSYTYVQNRGQQVSFLMSVEPADDACDHHAQINRWVAQIADSIPFTGDFKSYSKTLADTFFGFWPKKETNMEYFDITEALLYHKSKKYLTYMMYTSTFTGGAHGMYGYWFPTYIIDENTTLTAKYAFKEGSEEEVRQLIFEGMAENPDFATNNNINTSAQARRFVEPYLSGLPLPIPDPGLLPEGVVFCYQPYDIASYATGVIQLVIPYEKIKHLMTDKCQRLL